MASTPGSRTQNIKTRATSLRSKTRCSTSPATAWATSEGEHHATCHYDFKFEDFPFLLRNEKTDFIECVRAREPQTLEDAEVGHRSSTVVQLAYIACLLGRKLKWDPVKEECPGDEEANTLVRGQPGLPPWTIP